MNVNEVIATLAGEGVHPNDHVNMGQSSNDVVPVGGAPRGARAVHERAAAGAAQSSSARSRARRGASRTIVKAGRTHLMDAVPGDARPGVRRLRGADRARPRARRATRCRTSAQIPLGGTATGTGLNTHPQFAARVLPAARARARRARALGAARSASRRRPTATRSSSSRAR